MSLVLNTNDNWWMALWNKLVFNYWYPDFNWVLFMPFIWRYSSIPTAQVTVWSTNINFLWTTINEVQMGAMFSELRTNNRYFVDAWRLCAKGWTTTFTSLCPWKFSWWEIVWKRMIAHMIWLYVDNWLRFVPDWYWINSASITVSLINQSWVLTNIWTISLTWSNKTSVSWMTETSGVVASAGDMIHISCTVDATSSYTWRCFGLSNTSDRTWWPYPIQISVD